MAASYLTATYVNQYITSAVRISLFDDDEDGSLSASEIAAFDELVTGASEQARAYAENAGYVPGDSTTSRILKKATLGIFLIEAYQRRQQNVPEQFATLLSLAEELRTGALEIYDLTPTTRDAVGGSSFTETDSSVSGSREQKFSRSKLTGY